MNNINKSKRNLEIISGAMAAVSGIFIVVACALTIVFVNKYDSGFSAGAAKFFIVIELALCAAAISFGAILSLAPYKNQTLVLRKTALIFLIVVFSMLSFWYFLSIAGTGELLAVLMFLVSASIVVLSTIALNKRCFNIEPIDK